MKTQLTTSKTQLQNIRLFGYIVLGVLTVLLATAQPAAAYRSFEQTATKVNDTTILFTITFGFGTRTNEFFIPATTNRSTPYLSQEDIVGYEILHNGATSTAGVSHSIVLADLSVTDGEYLIPEASTGLFTFVSLVQFDEPLADTDEYTLQITSLPHYVGEDRDRRFVNEYELATFITPRIGIE